MFSKILIANRGEIACRVIKTARRLGIKTVAVYSEADSNARHVRLADEALLIGPAAAKESYLSIDKIIAAAKQSGAQAIHPGYGFLSENEDFCRACEREGIVFIGPPANAIRAMGSKSEAKKLMETAGVPLTPGYHGDDQGANHLQQQATAIGYPVLIKASAGGGGKGMRLVRQADDFNALLTSCKREAAASFGNDHVLVEKYIQRPRHIEIQIFGDTLGNYVHLFERDCSVQRRHQKVLEEAPAPGITLETRAAMGRAAIEAARAVGYVGAGTVEFIVDQNGAFYFMEMNTRLQVEHPITEMITGQDLVEWQLRVAAGQALPLTQDQIQIKGHAIEARIYAEDPANDFLPSTGRLVHFSTPAPSTNVRVDTGVEQGDEISPHYDPMIAKLIVWDDTRELALTRMAHALSDCRIVGVANNVAFLSRLISSPSFVNADLHTGLIESESDALFAVSGSVPDDIWLLATLAELLQEQAGQTSAARSRTVSAEASIGVHTTLCNGSASARNDFRTPQQVADPTSPWHSRDGWRLNGTARRELTFSDGCIDQTIAVTYADARFMLHLNDGDVLADGQLGPHCQLRADLNGRRLTATVIGDDDNRHVFAFGQHWQLHRVDGLSLDDGFDDVEGGLLAPMPGKIVALSVEQGATVEKGAPLLVLEAMKMEHTITAPSAGTVAEFYFQVGDQVEHGAELVRFEGTQ